MASVWSYDNVKNNNENCEDKVNSGNENGEHEYINKSNWDYNCFGGIGYYETGVFC